MQKDQRKTDFWIANKSQQNKAAPGKYNVPIMSGRKDYYRGPASFGSTENRFDRKVVSEKKTPPGPGDYEVEPLSIVSHNRKNTYNSVFNSKVDNSRQCINHSSSNTSLNRINARTANSSHIDNSNFKEGINFQKASKRKQSNPSFGGYHERFSNTYQFDTTSKTSTELGSLVLNSPVNKHKKNAMKLRTGLVSQIKTSPSIPYKKYNPESSPGPGKYHATDDRTKFLSAKNDGKALSQSRVLSPMKYSPNLDLLHRRAPVPHINEHKTSAPNNSGSLNKYIEVFMHDVVDSTSNAKKSVAKILETINK